MSITKKDLNRFREIFQVPDFIEPWLDRFFTVQEISLILLVSEAPLSMADIAERWTGDARHREPEHLRMFMDRSCKRGIVSRNDDDKYMPTDFHERFDSWALFEGWMDLPDDIRKRLNSWELDYYIKEHQNQINTLKEGTYRDPSLIWPEYVLLPEAMDLIGRAKHIYLWPCNCRSMMGRCAKNIYTCVRFSNHREAGWAISASRAGDIIKKANDSGLMQSAEISIGPDGCISGAICNCCADCCFPHQLAEHQDAAKLWPLTRYVAVYIDDRCTACGTCVRRCPFGAFSFGKSDSKRPGSSVRKKREKRPVILDRNLCRGCGVCSTGCPENAIEMIRLDDVESAWENQLEQGDDED
jgi:ferredoxin